jgi:glycosyltransferase involved in cell wall biosynthesis
MSRIDVIVPCYNYGRFLEECVATVTAQSHRDLRVLIIDDASTDETAAVGTALAASDARITFRRHQTNQGHITTYNEGLDWADGDYLLVLSADDLLLPGALASAAEVLDAAPEVGLVYGAFVLYHQNHPLPYWAERPWAQTLPTATRTLDEQEVGEAGWRRLDRIVFIGELGIRNHVGMSSAVTRLSVQRRLGEYRPDLPHAADLEMWLRFALYSEVAYVDRLQSVYRRHRGNMSKAYDGLPDLSECVRSFSLHYPAIRALPSAGPELERRIRRHHRVKASKLATRALRQGQLSLCRQAIGIAVREAFGLAPSGPVLPAQRPAASRVP